MNGGDGLKGFGEKMCLDGWIEWFWMDVWMVWRCLVGWSGQFGWNVSWFVWTDEFGHFEYFDTVIFGDVDYIYIDRYVLCVGPARHLSYVSGSLAN